MAERIPRPGEFYRHFKNKMYQIVAIAEHSETGEALVIYQALYGDFRIYARPLDMFLEEVDRDKYPRAAQKYRFEWVSGPDEKSGEKRKISEAEIGTAEKNTETVRNTGFFDNHEKDIKSRLDTWNSGKEEAGEMPSDGEDYEEAELLSVQESVVIPRSGRAEEKEDELWESLTDEVVQAAGEEQDEGETETVSPKFLDFLEARTFESKAVILESMKEELDDEMIDGLAMAVDVEIPEGSIGERYHQLEQCLRTMARYEDHRLR